MDLRVGLVILLVFAGNCVSDARKLDASEDSGAEIAGKKVNLCAICEQYVVVGLEYLKDEKTQNEILETLHNTCSQMRNLADQCTTMVDQYAETFFSEVSMVKPEGFCKKVGFCKTSILSSLPEKRNKCEVCHQAVDGVLDKLKDPDTELDIIERLLKACNSVGDEYRGKCKKMIFEFGPVLLVDAGSFVEKLDICTAFHACTRKQVQTDQVLPKGMIEMVILS